MISAKTALALAVGTALVTACCGGPPDDGGSDGSPPAGGSALGKPVGSVNEVDSSTVRVAGDTAGKGTDIYRTQHVATDAQGKGTFKAGAIEQCILQPHSDVTVQPSADVLLSHNGSTGSASCKKKAGGKEPIKVSAQGWVIVTMTDPVWTVELSADGVVVRVAEGSVTVGVTDTSIATVTLTAGQEVPVLQGKPPSPPRYFVFSDLPLDEQSAYQRLGLDIVAAGKIQIVSPTPDELTRGLVTDKRCGIVLCRTVTLAAQAEYAEDGGPVPSGRMRWSVVSGGVVEQSWTGSAVSATLAYSGTKPCGDTKPYEITLTVLDAATSMIVVATRTFQVILKIPDCPR